MRMKTASKFWAPVLVLSLAVTLLTGCGKQPVPPESGGQTTDENQTESTFDVSDTSDISATSNTSDASDNKEQDEPDKTEPPSLEGGILVFSESQGKYYNYKSTNTRKCQAFTVSLDKIDPETGEVLPEGEKGELVFTSLDKEAFPLLRYRTRDICVLSREKCSCGRTHVRMSKPMGRSDDMMIIRGVNVFPSQIETVLLNEGYTPNYQIVVDRENNSDTLDIYVELSADQFSDKMSETQKREKVLTDAMRAMLGIGPKIHLVAPKTIVRSEGKAVRVIDKRKLHD